MPGYFDDHSLIRRVQREHVVALAGPRALLMQAAHPVAFAGFFAATTALGDPYARLRRTADVIDTIVFGERADADRQAARVRRVHSRVRGRLAEPAGRFPAGTPWAADDPDLLLWIIATLADSGRVVFERYVRALDDSERERHWQDHRVMGALFGLEPEDMPGTYGDLQDYMAATLESETLHVTPAARDLAIEIVLHPPVPLAARPLIELANAITIGLLPARLRREYGLRWDPLRGLAVRAGAEYTKRLLLPVLPGRLRHRQLSAPVEDRRRGADERAAAGDRRGRSSRPGGQPVPAGDRRGDVREVPGDRRREPRLDGAPAQRRGKAAGVQEQLPHPERAERHLRRRASGVGSEPAAREPLGSGDERRSVRDPERKDAHHH